MYSLKCYLTQLLAIVKQHVSLYKLVQSLYINAVMILITTIILTVVKMGYRPSTCLTICGKTVKMVQ